MELLERKTGKAEKTGQAAAQENVSDLLPSGTLRLGRRPESEIGTTRMVKDAERLF